MNYYSKYLKYKNKYLTLKNNIEKLNGLQLGGASAEGEKDKTPPSETGSFFDDLFSPKSDEEAANIDEKEQKAPDASSKSSNPFGRITSSMGSKDTESLKKCIDCNENYSSSLSTTNGRSFCPHCGKEELEQTDVRSMPIPTSSRFGSQLEQPSVSNTGLQDPQPLVTRPMLARSNAAGLPSVSNTGLQDPQPLVSRSNATGLLSDQNNDWTPPVGWPTSIGPGAGYQPHEAYNNPNSIQSTQQVPGARWQTHQVPGARLHEAHNNPTARQLTQQVPGAGLHEAHNNPTARQLTQQVPGAGLHEAHNNPTSRQLTQQVPGAGLHEAHNNPTARHLPQQYISEG